MKAEIKKIDLVDHNFASYWPNDITNFYVIVDVGLGPVGSDGCEYFSLHVCSPSWFAMNNMSQPKFVRHFLFLEEYDDGLIKSLVNRMVSEAERDTWHELGEYFSRYMKWEFEDYSESGDGIMPSFPFG